MCPFFGKEWQQHIKSEHNDCEVVSAKEFDWVVLRIGPLHVEMNMVKTFVALNWDVMVCDLCEEMGFTSEAALKYAKSATNHHHAMTMIDILQKGVWSEFLVPYVRQRMAEGNPVSVNDFLYQWMEIVKDPNYLFMFEQLWQYTGAIRRNNHDYVNAGLLAFSPMFIPTHQSINSLRSMIGNEELLNLTYKQYFFVLQFLAQTIHFHSYFKVCASIWAQKYHKLGDQGALGVGWR